MSEKLCTGPIDKLEDLLQFRAKLIEPGCVGTDISDKIESRLGEDRQRLLLCHDLRGGYLQDRFVDPVAAESLDDCYHFYHWSVADIFVYFSHHLVTIPPVGWINAAHRHGVIVLGTFITEFDDGAAICKELLKDNETIEAVASNLAEVAKAYNFDGWLINIENVVDVEQVNRLVHFVGQVTAKCKERLGARSQVIWYDSVTEAGTLDWQNALNDNNEVFFNACDGSTTAGRTNTCDLSGLWPSHHVLCRVFFNACDGIFLNYCWTDEHLATSVAWAEKSSRSPRDVYVGIDCFGRGCPGGGGYDSYKALELIRQNGRMSVAMFAFSWCFEKHGGKGFLRNDEQFWIPCSKLFECRKVTKTPLVTKFRSAASQNKKGDWNYCLSSQDLQPHFSCGYSGEGPTLRIGESVKSPVILDGATAKLSSCRLFCTEIPVSELTECSLDYTHNEHDSCPLAIVFLLHTDDADASRRVGFGTMAMDSLNFEHHVVMPVLCDNGKCDLKLLSRYKGVLSAIDVVVNHSDACDQRSLGLLGLSLL